MEEVEAPPKVVGVIIFCTYPGSAERDTSEVCRIIVEKLFDDSFVPPLPGKPDAKWD